MFTEPIETPDLMQSQSNNSLVFIDSAVTNYQSLISTISPQAKVVMLDSSSDGIAQISEELARYSDVSSVHLVSHGEPGSVQLGTTQLNFDTLARYDELLEGWAGALTDTADILLYGCNVAASDNGEAFLQTLSKLTGAEVAASSNLTGSQTMGGDWQLEVVTGKIEAGLAFQPLVGETYNTVLHAGHDHDEEVQDHSEHDEKEHTAFLDLVPHSMATHVAVKNGSWSSSKTWKNGKVPGNEANVLIPEGRSVTYNVNSDARLNTLRVDGMLNFAQGQNTKMLIDTFTVAPEGKLSIGTEDNPIQADRTARIIFTSDSPIDRAKDPKQFGQGLITHGDVRIYGANKLDYVALKNDALKGDNELVLNLPNGASVPAGWRVGDQLVLGGTSYSAKGSDEDNSRFQDEVLTITAVNGNRIRFTNNNITSGDNSVLRFDHERPEGFEDEGLKLYVANTTRNVSFETENADRASLQQRGHVMFMHNPDVQVHNAGFYNLGRTDKSKPIDDPGQNVNGSSGSGTNPRGRYSLHFHKIVTEDINSTPASATGNAVVGSPGWGIVHHASYAVLEDNVVFDVVGSGIVAEAGNEIGAWRNNITIKTTGDGDSDTDLRVDPIRPDRVPLFDFGYQGEGYWVQGAAQVEMIDNIAISAAGGGIDIFGKADELDHYREAPTFPVAYLPSKLQFLAQKGESGIDVANLPLRRLSGFESYNSIDGIIFWQHMGNNDGQLGFNTPDPDPAHNARALVDDFKLWNIVRRGVHLQYGTQIDLVDGLILGNTSRPNPFSVGISHNEFAQNHLYKNLRIEGFEEGMRVPREGGNDESVSFLGSRLENSYLANNTYNLSEQFSRQTSAGSYVFPDYFEIVNTTFSVPGDNKAPTAKFNYQADGGLAVNFDASASFDSDSPKSLGLSSNEIASYGWDFNNDGTIDQFGREVSHFFSEAGSYKVTLTVWDSQGATNALAQTASVTPTAYPNLIMNGNFSASEDFERSPNLSSSIGAGKGWFANPAWKRDPKNGDGGAAVLSGSGVAGLSQVLLDNSIRRGEQTLSFDLKNTEGNSIANEINVSVWGINGQFDYEPFQVEGPKQVGVLPLTSSKLLEETVGGSTFDWRTFDWDVDFDEGYQFILFQVAAKGASPNNGDFIAIDNVELKSDKDRVMSLKFAETGGTVAADSSGEGRNNSGELRNGAEFRTVGGQFGNVVDFDGVNDYIHVNNSTDINGNYAKRTVSLWFKVNDIDVSERKQVIYEEGGAIRGLNIYVDQGKLFVGGWNSPEDESDWQGTFLSTEAIASNTWHHVALVLDAREDVESAQSGALTAYLDGVKFGQGGGSQLWSHSDLMGLGAINNATRFHDRIATGTGSHGLAGSLGAVRLYNRTLTGNEIARQASTLPPFEKHDQELVMHLNFDETAGTVAVDSSIEGRDNPGELRNGAEFQTVGGRFGNIVNFDGVNDYIHVNGSLDINFDTYAKRTISLWFKADNVNVSERKQVIYEQGGATTGLNIYVDKGRLYVGGWDLLGNWKGTFLSTDAIASNTWHHVTLVLDAQEGVKTAQSGAFAAYLDGVKFGQGEGMQLSSHGDPTGLGAVNSAVRFHDRTASGTGSHGLAGDLEGVRLYNRVLTAQEIISLAKGTSPFV